VIDESILPTPQWISDDAVHLDWPWVPFRVKKLRYHSMACVCARCLRSDLHAATVQSPTVLLDVIVG
jgi:hypothetical protein